MTPESLGITYSIKKYTNFVRFLGKHCPASRDHPLDKKNYTVVVRALQNLLSQIIIGVKNKIDSSQPNNGEKLKNK